MPKPRSDRLVATLVALLTGVVVSGCASSPGPGSERADEVTAGPGSAQAFLARRVEVGVQEREPAGGAVLIVTATDRGPDGTTGSEPEVEVETDSALEAVAAVTPDALARVERLWAGAPTAQDPVLVVLAGTGAAYEDLTGTTDGPGATVSPPGAGGESFVVLHPDAVGRLTGEGLGALLAHELTHVAQRAVPGDGRVPLWLSEGLAEYTALGGDPATVARLAVPDTAEPRAAQVGAGLPTDEEVRADAAAGRGYTESWTLLAMLAAEAPAGADGVVGLHADVRGGRALRTALPERTGLTEGEVPTRWRAWTDAARGQDEAR